MMKIIKNGTSTSSFISMRLTQYQDMVITVHI